MLQSLWLLRLPPCQVGILYSLFYLNRSSARRGRHQGRAEGLQDEELEGRRGPVIFFFEPSKTFLFIFSSGLEA